MSAFEAGTAGVAGARGARGAAGTVYLLHFERPLHHARHYLGWARHLDARLRHHERGSGAWLTAAMAAAGIGWTVARLWEDADCHVEARLKRRHAPARLCPVCYPGLPSFG